jgi:tetratricopeptide (TPR) repeat protein
MTQPHSTSLRTAAAAALLLACAGTSGCGATRLLSRHHPVPPATPASARVTSAHTAEAQAPHDARDPFWPYQNAVRLVAADSLAPAEAELKAALALDPAYAPALSLLSKLLFASGRHREAVTLLEPVRLEPDAYAPEARLQLLAGLALHEDALGETDRAARALAPVIEAGSRQAGSAGVYVTLRGETPDAATELARDVARRDSKSAVHQNNLGITRLRSGDVDGARKAFASAIERDPSLPGPYYNLAILEKYYRFDDAAAARWFAEYWNRSHDDPDGLRGVFAAGVASDAPANGGNR